jgi:hypothetical protein
MTADRPASRPQPPTDADAADAPMPTFAEQLSTQLGGWRGMVESAVPVTVFVVVNMVASLRPAVISSVAVAVAIAVWRLLQRRPVRYAVNGVFGIALGAVIAWRSGDARDFYLPGIFISYGYAALMIISVVVRQPVVGWIWSVIMAGGASGWRSDPRLLRTFTWLTLLWAAVWIIKVSIQAGLYLADQEHLLGAARLALGTPPYLLLLAVTIWVVRRIRPEFADQRVEA